MKTQVACVSALFALTIGGGALAADLPTRKAPMAPAPIAPAFTWQGFYLGAYVGGAWDNTSLKDTTFPAQGTPSLSSSSATFGALAGYNFVVSQFVFGVEGELGYDHRSGSGGYAALSDGLSRVVSESGNSIDRIRARLGYGAGNVLFYGAGGVSFANLAIKFNNPNSGYSQQISNTLTGWNLGAGVEYAFTDHWTARVEYIYDKFSGSKYQFLAADPVNGFDNRTARLSENTVRIGVAYKF